MIPRVRLVSVLALAAQVGCGSVSERRQEDAHAQGDAAEPDAPPDRPAAADDASPGDAAGPMVFDARASDGAVDVPPSACPAGFGDCNGSTADGCEARLDSAEHCGSCDHRCSVGTEVCLAAGGISQCTNPAAPIDHLRWEVPCGPLGQDGQLCADLPPGATACPTAPAGNHPVDRMVTFGGRAGTVYQVTIRFRGVVEPRIYLGGMGTTDHFRIGGMPRQPSGFNSYSLTVSAPARTYFVNADDGAGESRAVFPLDHQKTIAISGGATVRLQVEDPDCSQVRNCMDVAAATCRPVVPAGFPAYNGQFVQMDVVTVRVPPMVPAGQTPQ
jgi:hypothetical protein